MTTGTVTAGDTAQAMDKIVERLGEDALILETVKRNGRIEMIATDPEDAPIPLALGRSSDAEEAARDRLIWRSEAPLPSPTCSTSR